MKDVLAAGATPPGGSGGGTSDGWWAAGLALAERHHVTRGPRPGRVAEISEPARRRLQTWQDAHGLGENGQFAARLADAGLGEDDLLRLPAEPAEAVAARAGAPGWATFVGEVLSTPWLPPGSTADQPAEWSEGFARTLAPFLDVADNRLARAATINAVDFGDVRAEFRRTLAARLVRAAARALVLDLNTARESGRLAGATREERFADFVRQRQGRTELEGFLRRYPVLARVLG